VLIITPRLRGCWNTSNVIHGARMASPGIWAHALPPDYLLDPLTPPFTCLHLQLLTTAVFPNGLQLVTCAWEHTSPSTLLHASLPVTSLPVTAGASTRLNCWRTPITCISPTPCRVMVKTPSEEARVRSMIVEPWRSCPTRPPSKCMSESCS